MSLSDFTHLQDLNLYELSSRTVSNGDRTDNTSSIWRLMQWSSLLLDYFNNPTKILFGLGADYSFYTTGLPPHNDHLLILIEYGLFVYAFIFTGICKLFKAISKNIVFVPIFSVIFYHFSENLLPSFPAGAIFYFIIGYVYIKCINNEGITIK